MTKKSYRDIEVLKGSINTKVNIGKLFFLFQSNLSLIQSYLADTGSRQTEKSQSTLYIYSSLKKKYYSKMTKILTIYYKIYLAIWKEKNYDSYVFFLPLRSKFKQGIILCMSDDVYDVPNSFLIILPLSLMNII